MKTFKVDKEDSLLEFLFEQFSDKSKTTVKSYLVHRQVDVNGTVSTQFNDKLKPGDAVTVTFGRTAETLKHPMLRIVFEDDYIIVVEKKAGLLSVIAGKQLHKAALNILTDYVKKDDPSKQVFVLHRLDREASGLMIFSKDQRIKFKMQTDWESVVIERKYYAVVEGVMDRDEEVIATYLTESKALIVYATTYKTGEIAHTKYKVLKRSKTNTLIELELEVGRKNQIRCHMNYIGHPIVGDKKYGSKTNPIKRVALHAGKISFIHPHTNERMDFSTPIPRSFEEII